MSLSEFVILNKSMYILSRGRSRGTQCVPSLHPFIRGARRARTADLLKSPRLLLSSGPPRVTVGVESWSCCSHSSGETSLGEDFLAHYNFSEIFDQKSKTRFLSLTTKIQESSQPESSNSWLFWDRTVQSPDSELVSTFARDIRGGLRVLRCPFQSRPGPTQTPPPTNGDEPWRRPSGPAAREAETSEPCEETQKCSS